LKLGVCTAVLSTSESPHPTLVYLPLNEVNNNGVNNDHFHLG
jgi:hypothetical protein